MNSKLTQISLQNVERYIAHFDEYNFTTYSASLEKAGLNPRGLAVYTASRYGGEVLVEYKHAPGEYKTYKSYRPKRIIRSTSSEVEVIQQHG